MPYNSSTGIISINTATDPHQGISIYDIQQALGIGVYNDIGGLITYGAANNKIKKWAKYKPVRSSKLGIMTLADFQDVYFGLTVPIYGTGYTTNISTFLGQFPSSYAYNAPRGKDGGGTGVNEWFRFLDFNGYNNNATPFVYEQGCTFPHSYAYGGAGAGGCNFTLSLNTGTSLHDGIAIGDWKVGGSSGAAFNTYYFGLIFQHGTDTPKIVTSSYPVNDSQGRGYTLNIGDSGNDGLDGLVTSYSYTVYPILSRVVHSTVSSIGNATSETIVAIPANTFNFSQYPVSATVTYDIPTADAYIGARARLYISATIAINSTGGYTSISTNHIQLYRASSNTDTSGTLIKSYNDLPAITTTDPYPFEDSIQMDNFPAYVRIHLYNDSVSGMTLDYYVLVRQEEL